MTPGAETTETEAQPSLTREIIVSAALDLCERDGAASLTMRKLASSLGVAVTAIYWHIGNRDALLDAMIEAEMSGWKAIRAEGATPYERIVSFSELLRKRMLGGRRIIELIAERGRIFEIFVPAYQFLATEFLAAGLDEASAAMAVRTLQLHVVGAVVLQRRAEREASNPLSTALGEIQSASSRVTSAALAISASDAFDRATALLVGGLLKG